MRSPERQFNAITPASAEASANKPEFAVETSPIVETETAMSYLGVSLEKSKSGDGQFVPKREQYEDFINDKEVALPMQRDIAVAFLSGEPILLDGGTSLGKTTTVRKMAADLGWEVHYANLNGATDVEDLMGRYIPNPHKNKPEDPEYLFADGKVTSGLRQEEGKVKVVILDEFNASAPNILIRLHEVLDALERGGDVILSEDASEAVSVNKDRTKIIALMNPPGKGYFGREPLDPAQLRRWVYKKLPSELPEGTFSYSTDALFGFQSEISVDTGSVKKALDRTKNAFRLTDEDIENMPPVKRIRDHMQEYAEKRTIGMDMFLSTREQPLTNEQLQEIPGIREVLEKYKEFHKASKELLKNRKVAEDQPQPFTFDDRMEPRRVRDFILRFYTGDINETFQQALRYYYANKLESEADRKKFGELIRLVEYKPKVADSKRKGLEREEKTHKTLGDILRSKEEEKSPKSVELGTALESLRASGYLDTSFEGKETHPLTIRPLTKEEALTEYRNSGGKTWVWDVLEKDMPYTTPRAETLDVMIMNFGKSIGSDEAVAEMDKLGVRPLTYEELIQYGIAHPDHQKQKILVGLGTKHTLDGRPRAPVLIVDGGGRILGAVDWGDDWGDGCRFPVVRK